MNDKTLYKTLAVTTALAFTITLLLYALLSGRNPLSRIGYGIFVSVLPALLTIGYFKIFKRFAHWVNVATVYFVVVVLIIFSQGFLRTL